MPQPPYDASQAQMQPCQTSYDGYAAVPVSSSGNAGSGSQSNGAYKSDSTLYCYTCNQNSASCTGNYISSDFLTPCNGQCIKFRNPNDNYSKFLIFFLLYAYAYDLNSKFVNTNLNFIPN